MSNISALQRALRLEVISAVPGCQQTWEGQGRPVRRGPWVNLNPIQYPSQLTGDQRDCEYSLTIQTDVTLTLDASDTTHGANIELQGFELFAEDLAALRTEIDLWTKGILVVETSTSLRLTGVLWGLRVDTACSAIRVQENASSLFLEQVSHRQWAIAFETYVSPGRGDVAVPDGSSAMDVGKSLQGHIQNRSVLERLHSKGVVVLYPIGSLANLSGALGPQWQSVSAFTVQMIQTFRQHQEVDRVGSVATDFNFSEG